MRPDRLLPALFLPAALLAGLATAAPRYVATVSTAPGSLVRWSTPGTTRCGMSGKSWKPLGETCYFPVDLLRKPGNVEVARWGAESREQALISVGAYPYGTEEIDLGDIPQANPSPEELERNRRDQALVAKVWKRAEGPPRFSLPLGLPAKPLPEPKTFGWRRVFNGRPASQPHMGADYAIPAGRPVFAVADGTVALAEDLFYPGKAVFVDHGDGLISMSFHLSEMRVKTGDEVKKGDIIGLVGRTGRSSGNHLYFGVRWRGARIDPRFLLEDPARIPAVRD